MGWNGCGKWASLHIESRRRPGVSVREVNFLNTVGVFVILRSTGRSAGLSLEVLVKTLAEQFNEREVI